MISRDHTSSVSPLNRGQVTIAKGSARSPEPLCHTVPAAADNRLGRQGRCYAATQGLMRGTPVGSKSVTLRVTTVIPWTSAVAAMSASRKGRGSGT